MRRGYQPGPTLLLLHLRVKGCPFVVRKHACPIPLFPTTAPGHYFKCSRPLGSWISPLSCCLGRRTAGRFNPWALISNCSKPPLIHHCARCCKPLHNAAQPHQPERTKARSSTSRSPLLCALHHLISLPDFTTEPSRAASQHKQPQSTRQPLATELAFIHLRASPPGGRVAKRCCLRA